MYRFYVSFAKKNRTRRMRFTAAAAFQPGLRQNLNLIGLDPAKSSIHLGKPLASRSFSSARRFFSQLQTSSFYRSPVWPFFSAPFPRSCVTENWTSPRLHTHTHTHHLTAIVSWRGRGHAEIASGRTTPSTYGWMILRSPTFSLENCIFITGGPRWPQSVAIDGRSRGCRRLVE